MEVCCRVPDPRDPAAQGELKGEPKAEVKAEVKGGGASVVWSAAAEAGGGAGVMHDVEERMEALLEGDPEGAAALVAARALVADILQVPPLRTLLALPLSRIRRG